MRASCLEREIELPFDAHTLCSALRRPGSPSLLLDGQGGFEEAWGPLVALEPCLVPSPSLHLLDSLVTDRRDRGGPPGCGVVVLLGYELLDLVILSVDATIGFPATGAAVAAVQGGAGSTRASVEARLDATRKTLERIPDEIPAARVPPARGPLRTSLPRQAYLEGVERVKHHIRRGDIYQANLTQRFSLPHGGDPFEIYRALAAATPAPRSAFVEAGSSALASVSPEVFLRVEPDGTIETWPIKGTRPRAVEREEDLRLARSLVASEKDRAELLMIVDLERNDLGRVCRTGSVQVRELQTLRSFASVHHLMACVEGELRPDTRPSDLIRATFPGGSITGAPKLRAMEILREIEPAPRGFYTGSLLWFGDDGSMDSSILIRSVVMSHGSLGVGAGGGIVADSQAEAEWRESNDKARAILGVLGFAPEEALRMGPT